MECGEVQKRLSAYIEKAVSPKQKAFIDAHLKGCKRCKQALADLKKAVEYVQKLEEVEPPAWLVQKVMAQVRSEAEAKRGIWQRLFSPFHIKIPLEALALVLVAVGTIYIFKAMEPEMRIAQAPVEQKETAPPAFVPGKGEVHKLAEDKRPPAVREDRFRYADKEKSREQKSIGLAKAPAAAKREEAAPSTGVVATDELERGAVSSVVSEKAVAEGAVEAVNFMVNVKEMELAIQDIEETLQQLGGRKIKTQSLRDKVVINAEIESRQVRELFNQLNIIGEVQEQRGTTEAVEGEVGIRIDLGKTPKEP